MHNPARLFKVVGQGNTVSKYGIQGHSLKWIQWPIQRGSGCSLEPTLSETKLFHFHGIFKKMR